MLHSTPQAEDIFALKTTKYMMKREIIKIDQELCDGCGLCIPSCPEGALQVIDGKARLVSDLMCDGLGACIGECPLGAISIEEREAEPYNEVAVMQEIVKQGKNTVIAHLKHLLDHNEMNFFDQAVGYLRNVERQMDFSTEELLEEVYNKEVNETCETGGCPGMRSVDFSILEPGSDNSIKSGEKNAQPVSELNQWPVQMYLLNPNASFFKGADVMLAADCVAFTLGNFHGGYLKGKKLAIACPKLDHGKEVYIDKLVAMIDEAGINSLHIMVMEVPCCNGLLHIARLAADRASRRIPLKKTLVSIQGGILAEDGL
jgi:ferredoxin